jgi:arabinofuranan 3-O-arabinosyltransferase
MNDPCARLIRFLLARRTLYVAAWVMAGAVAIGRILNGHYCFRDHRSTSDPDRRADGNFGHTTIDFGGQWLMGRLLARGFGRELYSRPRQWEVAEQAFPRERERPDALKHDSEELLQHFMNPPDPRWMEFAGSVGAMAAPSAPIQSAAAAIECKQAWPAERLDEINHPKGPAGIGGPLYPPIHAFLMLPFATGDHPQAAYFAMQYVQALFCFVAGLAVSRLSQGRFWWPLASTLILIYPGCRGVVDLGQNGALSLALLLWGWVALAHGRPILGGIVWAGLAYKPVWAVSFILYLMLIRQWRMALTMAVAGSALVLATVPVVGLHSWLQWLAIGQEAARIYNVDSNWVPLSRDLLGIPRRFLIDFEVLNRDDRDNPTALLVSWALWAFVMEVTVRVYFLRGRRDVPFTGPLPAMLILATWMCTYHFMYYDSLISAFGVCVLLADPRPFFQARALNRGAIKDVFGPMDKPPSGRRSLWLVNSFALTAIALMLFHENVTQPLKFEATIVAHSMTSKRTLENETTELAPRLVVGTSDRYPLDTFMIMALWGWCFGAVLARRWTDDGSMGIASNGQKFSS